MNKVVLITGASSGMGLDTALDLLASGYTVYAGARRLKPMAKIEENGGTICQLDVTNEESMVECVNRILEKEGRIDVLVNNAGYGSGGTIEEVPMDEVRNQFEVNVFGLGRMTQLVLPTMRKQRSGKIINIASMGGHFTTPFLGWYHATKYALESISDALRMEVTPFGIDVVCIDPGMIDTNWGVITSKNIKKVTKEKDYQANALAVTSYYDARYGQASSPLSSPKVISNTIVKAVKTNNPKNHYLVGKGAKLYVFLKWLLPEKIYQLMVCRSMGLK